MKRRGAVSCSADQWAQVAAERTRWDRAPFRRSGGMRQVGSGSAFLPILIV